MSMISKPHLGAAALCAGAAGLFLLASAVYLWGLCPTIYWHDAPEFVTVAHALDISHPTGSPTYALVAKLLTFVPIGSVALRVNAVSALAAALTVTLVFLLLSSLFSTSALWVRTAAAGSGALFLLVSESLWRLAEVAEVYTLQNCFIVFLLYVLVQVRSEGPSCCQRFAWLFAWLYGLSAGVHASMALCVPAFLGFLGLTAPRTYRGKGLAFLAFFFLLGFAVYLYLPIRSLTGPAFDWGYPQTWQRFLDHITDRGHAPLHTMFAWQQLPYQLQRYLGHVINEFALLGGGLGLLGFCVLLPRDPALWGMLLLVFLGNVLFFVRIWTDTAWGFIPSFVIFALWVGYGMHACLTLLARLTQQFSRRLWRVTVYAGLWGGVAITLGHLLVRHAAVTSQAQNYATALYGAQLIEQLPPDALLISEYEWFPLLYLQQVERQRPDLTFLRQGGVFVTRARFPNIRLGTSETLAMQSPAAFLQLAKLNAPEHPLFLSLDGDWQHYFAAHLRPRGLLFTLHPGVKVDVTPEDLQSHEHLLAHTIERLLQGAREDAATFFLAHKLNLTALYFAQIGFFMEAAKTYEAALHLRPDYDKAIVNYAALLISQGNLAEAQVQLDLAYGLHPAHPTVNKTLGVLMLRMANMARAADFFERAIAFGETGGDIHAQLGEIYARLGRFSAARRALQSALARYREPTAQNAADSRLQEKIAAVMKTLQRVETWMGVEPSAR